jgi:hypothetical protein
MDNRYRRYFVWAVVAFSGGVGLGTEHSYATQYDFNFTTDTSTFSGAGTFTVDASNVVTAVSGGTGDVAGWTLAPAGSTVGPYTVGDLLTPGVSPPFYGLGPGGVWFNTGSGFEVLNSSGANDYIENVSSSGDATFCCVLVIDTLTPVAAPGPIPGAGLLSYLALGLLGLGSMGWKRLRAA